jgi:hypothetical protein
LPKSIGEHNNYWIWGPRDFNGELLLFLGGAKEELLEDFESVEQIGVSDCNYCMPYENHVKIFICRRLKAPIREVWLSAKNYE